MTDMLKNSWAIVVACGPGDREIERVADVLDSTFCHEPGTRWAVIIDSADEDRHLADRFTHPEGTTIAAVRNPKTGWADGQWGPLCAGVLGAYEWIVKNTDAKFVVKYDSDALTIAPFSVQIERAMRDNPDAGIFGSYKFDCYGNYRGIGNMKGLVRRLHKFALFEYQPKRFGRRFPFALFGRPAGMRRHISHALDNGYELGEHTSGGAYAASRELLDRMAKRGYFNQRYVWADSQMSEDVMMGIYCRACDLVLAGHAANGDAFGVKHVGLPDTPERLLERGYSIIHSLKNDGRFTEEQIRAFYREKRAGHGSYGLKPVTPVAKPASATAHRPLGVDEELDDVALGY
jgi:hypothetical protein